MQYKEITSRISNPLKKWYQFKYLKRYKEYVNYKVDSLLNSSLNYQLPQNIENKFEGNMYLLINNKTYSAAATFAGIFKELNLGSIIGEETGGHIAYYGDFWFMKTPKVKLNFYISPKRFIQFGGVDYNRGVVPDYLVKDDPLKFTKELISH